MANSDISDIIIDFIGGFTGTSKAKKLATAQIDEVEIQQAYDRATALYDECLASCGNEGQMALMEQIGAGGFMDCVSYGIESKGEIDGFLEGMTDHAEVIGDILGEAEEELKDILSEIIDNEEFLDED